MKWIGIILLCMLFGWIGSCAYQDFREFENLKPQCEALGGTIYKISSDWVCLKDLLKP